MKIDLVRFMRSFFGVSRLGEVISRARGVPTSYVPPRDLGGAPLAFSLGFDLRTASEGEIRCEYLWLMDEVALASGLGYDALDAAAAIDSDLPMPALLSSYLMAASTLAADICRIPVRGFARDMPIKSEIYEAYRLAVIDRGIRPMNFSVVIDLVRRGGDVPPFTLEHLPPDEVSSSEEAVDMETEVLLATSQLMALLNSLHAPFSGRAGGS